MSSLKMTFSLASLILIFALAAMPAMAGKIEATWSTDRSADGTADDAGWRVTLTFPATPAPTAPTATNTDATGITTLNVVGLADIAENNIAEKTAGVPDGTKQWTFDVDVASGTTILVQLAGYQRVIFPAAANGAEVALTDLVHLAKLMSVPNIYIMANAIEDIVFTFEPADTTNKIGAPGALHESDVVIDNTGGATVTTASVSGNNTVKVRSAGTDGGTATVTLSTRIVQAQTPLSTVRYDATAPTGGTGPNDGATTISVDRRKPPAPDQWGAVDFDFIFSIVEATPNGIQSVELEDNRGLLEFSNVNPTGVAIADTLTNGIEYAATVSTKDVDITAGTVTTIFATVTDKAGNENTFAVGSVTLAGKTASAPAEAVYDADDTKPADGSDVAAGNTITVAFDKNPGTVTGTIDGVAADVGGSGTTRTVMIPTTATGSITIMLMWGTDKTQSLTYMIVEAAPAQVTVPAKSYVIIAKTDSPDGLPMSAIPANTAIGSSATDIEAWEDMPNLEDLFFRGGSLLLTTLKATKLDRDGDESDADVETPTDKEEAKARDLVITEIMAARNTALVGQDGYLSHQWIEIYNKLPVAVSVTLSAKSGRPAPTPADTEVELDLVSNVVSAGWNFADLGTDGFDNTGIVEGDTAPTLQPFASFYRNNRGEPGWQQSRWTTSTDTYFANHKGTPGAEERSGIVAVGKTDPTYDVVINEIGNYSEDKYDWIELRKKAGGTWNFKKWQIREITGDKAESTIVNIPDDGAYEAVPEILLIVATDPYRDPNHPLAAGLNITKDNGRLEKTGVTSSYYVAGTGFKLANSGKTLLLLRSRNDGGIHEGIVDLPGTHFIEDQSKDFGTEVWPLKGQTAGNDNHDHGDVVKGADEDFRSGHVYQRINDGRGTGKEVWERKGYTGVGYKRSASSTGQHGGTPGYANGAVKVNQSDLSDSAMVSISEIMYAKDGNVPQWIELYNSSMTQAIDLNEWKLKIEHSRDADDVDIRIPAVTTNNLGSKIIQPNQTVLLVSNTTGRVSRGAQGGIDFPASRVINLWAQKDKLEVDSTKNRLNYRLLSQTAFKVTLMDKSGTAIDTVGNLGADGMAMWELPMSEEDEGRSSIIRRYDEGVPRDGTMEPSGDGMGPWVLASMSPLSEVRVNETYYGNPDDIGTPGYRGGGPLPVSLSKFRPERLDDGTIVVRWVTESELNNAGFNILRSDTRNGQFAKINTSLIAGNGTTSERTVYEWKDTSAKPNVVYYYQIQDVSLDGKVTTLRQTRLKGDISPAGKLTTTWGELKALQ